MVVLLAVYAFITMPVQLWHSHTMPYCGIDTAVQQDHPADYSICAEDATGDFCSICAHHYSAYSDETCFILPGIISEIYQPADFFACSIPDAAIPGSCNKGPPAAC